MGSNCGELTSSNSSPQFLDKRTLIALATRSPMGQIQTRYVVRGRNAHQMHWRGRAHLSGRHAPLLLGACGS